MLLHRINRHQEEGEERVGGDLDAVVLERELRRQLARDHARDGEYRRARYDVQHRGAIFFVLDCWHDPPRAVQGYRGPYFALSCALYGNVLGQCSLCAQPAIALVYGANYCVVHLPPSEDMGLVSLGVLRIWRDAAVPL